MLASQAYETIDYLAIGHITRDITPDGTKLGGSVSYAALMARAMGLRAGIVTSWGEELSPGVLDEIPIRNHLADASTAFENTYSQGTRSQRLHQIAPELGFHMIPEGWRDTPILHLAPVAGEVSPRIIQFFDAAFIGVTPQGWLRDWDAHGNVVAGDWHESDYVLSRADAVVLSLEDVGNNYEQIERLAALAPLLAVTKAEQGAQIYVQGKLHEISAPEMRLVDATGAGDIFAAAFFARLYFGDNPLQAGYFATRAAALSVERPGLEGIPSRDELYDLLSEAL